MFCLRNVSQVGLEGVAESAIAVVAFEDGSVVWAGSSYDTWGGSDLGGSDFVAAKMDSAGSIVWRWQVTLTHDNFLLPMIRRFMILYYFSFVVTHCTIGQVTIIFAVRFETIFMNWYSLVPC